MILGGFFQKVKSISPDEVREVIKSKGADEYCLLDVRQPGEYEQGHLPGAKLIPLSELQYNLDKIRPDRRTIVYCRSGNRSRSAVGILNGAGLDDVFNMERGILGYRGTQAAGPPEAGVFCFPENMSPEQLTAMAWYIEDGSQRFFEAVREKTQGAEEKDVISRLIDQKITHKESLFHLFKKISGSDSDNRFPADILPMPPHDVMAGCVSVPDAVAWSKDKQVTDILDMLMALEANTLDLYLKLGRQVASESASSVFVELSDEQVRHLEQLGSILEKTL